MTFSKRFGALFLVGVFCSTAPAYTSATMEDPYTNIPDDFKKPLTVYMLKHCPQISCGEGDDGFFLRHATPDNYKAAGPEIVANRKLDASVEDQLFYDLRAQDCLGNCLVAIVENEYHTPLHPNTYTPNDYLERAYAFFKKGDGDEEDTLLGFIHSAPGSEKERLEDRTKLSYYILKEYRTKGYAAPMISGFVNYLNTLRGKRLAQITLPDTDTCAEFVQKILRGEMPDITTKEEVLFTTIEGSVSLRNLESFIPLSRLLPLTEVHHIWDSDSPTLAYFVQGSEFITAEDLRELRQVLNTLLVFSTAQPRHYEEEGDEGGKSEEDEGERINPLTLALRDALSTYVNDKLERPTSLLPLQRAAFAHPVSHTMLPTADPTDKS